MPYLTNQVMEWNGQKVSDHNRSPLNEDVERIERKARMVDGTLRRYVVAKKRTWSCSWENLPSKNIADGGPVDGGMSGEQLETFHRDMDAKFILCRRNGSAISVTTPINLDDATFVPAGSGYPQESVRTRLNRGVTVEMANGLSFCYAMVTDFSKEVVKRGQNLDWWNLSITLEEV